MSEEKKLTDEEAVKALEICYTVGVGCCECPLDGVENCDGVAARQVVEYCRRLQSENKGLYEEVEKANSTAFALSNENAGQKAEIERLKGFLSTFETVIAEQKEDIEKSVEVLYPDFMKEYRRAKNDLKESLAREMELQKQIEEMAKVLVNASCQGSECEKCFFENIVEAKPSCVCVKALYNAGYRKIPENAVVLTKEEFKAYTFVKEFFDGKGTTITAGELVRALQLYDKQARKETAEKFAEG